jgi:hypothetical protein
MTGAKLRATAAFALLACTLAAQSQPSLNTLLDQLQSKEWTVRAEAVAQLNAASDLRDAPATKRGLLELLDRENHFARDPGRFNFSGVPENEAWAEYYSTVVGLVDNTVDPDDVSAVSILAQSIYNGDSPVAVRLGSFGQTVVPSLLARALDRKHPESRSEGYDVLGYVLQQHRLGASLHPLTIPAARDVEHTLRSGLRDADASVRMASIRAVTLAGDAPSLPILERVRASDPWFSPATYTYSIRERAERAIAAIKEHPLTK